MAELDDPWTPPRRRALVAVVKHLVPAADAADNPDAVSESVASTVMRTLDRPDFADRAPLVHAALDELDARAAAVDAARSFADLDADARENALRRLERDDNPYLAHALVVLLQLALEGLLGDPARGGNPGGVGWRRVGLSIDGLAGAGPRRRRGPSVPPSGVSDGEVGDEGVHG